MPSLKVSYKSYIPVRFLKLFSYYDGGCMYFSIEGRGRR